MINFSSNAILVKIRAKYAKRLSADDYKQLLVSENVSSVALYLKRKELYQQHFMTIDANVHRDQLEKTLMQGFLEDLSSLANYDLKFEKKIFKYILIHSEIQQITKFLTFLKSGNSRNFQCFLPSFLKSKSRVNFDKLNQIESYQDLILFFKGTEYYTILNEFDQNKTLDVNVIETSLYNYEFKLILNYIYEMHKSIYETRKFFSKCMDIINTIRIVRARKVCNPSKEYLSKISFKFGNYKFNNYDVCEENLPSIFGKDISSVGSLENLLKRLKFMWAVKNIRYSNISEIIGFSYILLRKTEIMNIINIIEGVRYNLPSDKINRMLIK